MDFSVVDILNMFDWYYVLSVILIVKAVTRTVTWKFASDHKGYLALIVGIVVGVVFITLDYMIGVENLSQSYKKLFLSFLFATSFYELLLKYIFGLLEK